MAVAALGAGLQTLPGCATEGLLLAPPTRFPTGASSPRGRGPGSGGPRTRGQASGREPIPDSQGLVGGQTQPGLIGREGQGGVAMEQGGGECLGGRDVP